MSNYEGIEYRWIDNGQPKTAHWKSDTDQDGIKELQTYLHTHSNGTVHVYGFVEGTITITKELEGHHDRLAIH